MNMHILEAFSPEPCLEHTYITKQFFQMIFWLMITDYVLINKFGHKRISCSGLEKTIMFLVIIKYEPCDLSP